MLISKVDYERIQAVGPDRAASEWLLRCGALVRYRGYEKWQQDYNGLPTGPLEKYKIEAINATDSCIMYRGFDYLGNVDATVTQVWARIILNALSSFSGIKI
ncbi:atp synthase subunit mitochondrial [Limosa lapponica baueri]|uniref:Atp synthase subunit mitochondrial n=1 Tax=Limosa lapponica baueri TaxID=1758121 RepID=A0A2I0T010_LIMLA|nr:atp synthase subunit mitochondrial [Limosa lapponica baueri]